MGPSCGLLVDPGKTYGMHIQKFFDTRCGGSHCLLKRIENQARQSYFLATSRNVDQEFLSAKNFGTKYGNFLSSSSKFISFFLYTMWTHMVVSGIH